MNKLRVASTLALGALACCLCGGASADRGPGHGHGHGHADIGVGIVVDPFWYGSWPYPGPYYYPPYYYPPVVAVPADPPVYIERGDTAPGSAAYWYYCGQPPGYYPYVKQCPGGWQPVSPHPPPPPDEER